MDPTTGYQAHEIASAIMGFFIFLTIIVGILLKFKGLITFGKPVERRQCVLLCKEHPAMEKVHSSLDSEIKVLRQGQSDVKNQIEKIDEKIDKTGESLHRIEGYLKARNGAGMNTGF